MNVRRRSAGYGRSGTKSSHILAVFAHPSLTFDILTRPDLAHREWSVASPFRVLKKERKKKACWCGVKHTACLLQWWQAVPPMCSWVFVERCVLFPEPCPVFQPMFSNSSNKCFPEHFQTIARGAEFWRKVAIWACAPFAFVFLTECMRRLRE